MHRTLTPSVFALASLVATGLAVCAVGSGLGACASDPGVDDLPGITRPGSSTGDGGGSTSPEAGGGGSPDATTDAGAAATSACAAYAAARCRHDDACTAGVSSLAKYGDEATCESRKAALCITDLTASGTAATALTTQSCAASIASQSCADSFNETPTPQCAALAGSLTTGAACVASSQCASTYCALANGVCGSCAAVPKAGDPCGSVAGVRRARRPDVRRRSMHSDRDARRGLRRDDPLRFRLTCTGATATAAVVPASPLRGRTPGPPAIPSSNPRTCNGSRWA